MRFLLLNQTFYPDVASSGQHLRDLALGLAQRGHEVTVLTSRRAYDDPKKLFPRQETWQGVKIIRVASTGFGKGAKWRRAADFASFMALCAWRLAFLPRHDAVVALTSPPLISFLGAWWARLRRIRFFYWVMDLNPDEAIAAGWLRPGSLAARVLESMSRFSLNRATKIIALDRFMRDRILSKGIPTGKIAVFPPWSHDGEVRFDPECRERFRKTHRLEEKFVVMYSGNHSPCHPLDTLLAAAERLREQKDIAFCFVGGGSEWRKIRQRANGGISNLLCLPYQPLDQLAGSLSAADLHLVVMGDPFVGIVHPCKIYNILSVGTPVLYIGPRPSHVTEIMETAASVSVPASECVQFEPEGSKLKVQGSVPTNCPPFYCSRHGEVDRVVEQILRAREEFGRQWRHVPEDLRRRFSENVVVPRLIAEFEPAG